MSTEILKKPKSCYEKFCHHGTFLLTFSWFKDSECMSEKHQCYIRNFRLSFHFKVQFFWMSGNSESNEHIKGFEKYSYKDFMDIDI